MRVAVALHQRLAFREFHGQLVVSRGNLCDLVQPRFDALVLDLVPQAAASEAPQGGKSAEQCKAADARGRNAASTCKSSQGALGARRGLQSSAQPGGQSAAD